MRKDKYNKAIELRKKIDRLSKWRDMLTSNKVFKVVPVSFGRAKDSAGITITLKDELHNELAWVINAKIQDCEAEFEKL